MNWQTMSMALSNWIFLFFVVGIPLLAWIRKVNVFGVFMEGAQDGFQLAVKIIPSLVAILVAVSMFRAAGGFTLLTHLLGPTMHAIGFPAAILPLVSVITLFDGRFFTLFDVYICE